MNIFEGGETIDKVVHCELCGCPLRDKDKKHYDSYGKYICDRCHADLILEG